MDAGDQDATTCLTSSIIVQWALIKGALSTGTGGEAAFTSCIASTFPDIGSDGNPTGSNHECVSGSNPANGLHMFIKGFR